jgi:hypothetical protein
MTLTPNLNLNHIKPNLKSSANETITFHGLKGSKDFTDMFMKNTF